MIKRIGPTSISRNSPCPCGSGRKFKKCCQVAQQVATAHVQAAKNKLNQVFAVGEGIIVKGVAFKIVKIAGSCMAIQDWNMSDEDIAKLSGKTVV